MGRHCDSAPGLGFETNPGPKKRRNVNLRDVTSIGAARRDLVVILPRMRAHRLATQRFTDPARKRTADSSVSLVALAGPHSATQIDSQPNQPIQRYTKSDQPSSRAVRPDA